MLSLFYINVSNFGWVICYSIGYVFQVDWMRTVRRLIDRFVSLLCVENVGLIGSHPIIPHPGEKTTQKLHGRPTLT